ncbi:hypothetical protein AgCh_008590 [Apium graveolens]
MKHSGMKLPDTRYAWYNMKINLEECEKLCLKNCLCTTYAKADIRKGGRGCYLSFNDLIDIEGYSEDGPDIYIRMAASELERLKFSSESIALTKIESEELELPLISFDFIEKTTNSFSHNNKLREGGFGPVFKADGSDCKRIIDLEYHLNALFLLIYGYCYHESNHIEFDTDMLMELLRREKDLGIEPDDDLDTFVKERAINYLLSHVDRISEWGELVQLVVLELIRKTDNNVKLILLDRLTELKSSHRDIMVNLIMDIQEREPADSSKKSWQVNSKTVSAKRPVILADVTSSTQSAAPETAFSPSTVVQGIVLADKQLHETEEIKAKAQIPCAQPDEEQETLMGMSILAMEQRLGSAEVSKELCLAILL